MPSTPPTSSHFPPHLTLTITPPSSTSTTTSTSPNTSPNILLLLHGLGDTSQNLTTLARALNLPETTILTLQAPTPLPFDLGGFHWGDDITFSPAGDLDMDAGFTRSTNTIIKEVIIDTLLKKCGYRGRDIVVFGIGQGGMVGLEVARHFKNSSEGKVNEEELGGVVSIGAPVGLSGKAPATGSGKSRTPVLIVAGKEDGGERSTAVTAAGVRRTKEWFEFVEASRYKRRGDGMPRNAEEMRPVMEFLARRLRSYKGVPEGSVELS
ncbi:phospholipase/carboxylesterase superfamily [Aspergillus piperis CBS 112811]|uniref:Phospholipase/carboxylesterase superfamily n=1 Tax=Aspergillus piperis CBS 112811 TaxID=1448313 RepID=A0A8G1RD34_9EURO|nr:phospholipase/carboxylesterase superfamily [Aspergillus piperis CBS 112811]RAH62956.1 phospholipase/carboxylesterase superfamily [Aspergillus piperis CBS 112811]